MLQGKMFYWRARLPRSSSSSQNKKRVSKILYSERKCKLNITSACVGFIHLYTSINILFYSLIELIDRVEGKLNTVLVTCIIYIYYIYSYIFIDLTALPSGLTICNILTTMAHCTWICKIIYLYIC